MVSLDGDSCKRLFVKDKLYVGTFYSNKTGLNTVATGESHGSDFVYSQVMASGDSAVGVNSITSVTGTGATWVSGSYTQIVEPNGSAPVSGYTSAGEFEIKRGTGVKMGDYGVLMLDSNIASTGGEARGAYIMLQDFGSVATNNLIRGLGMSPASANAAVLFSTAASPRTHTHSIRVMFGTTPYYIMVTSTGA